MSPKTLESYKTNMHSVGSVHKGTRFLQLNTRVNNNGYQ